MLDLEITDAAKLDIEDIFEYTLNFFGEKKANEYSFDLYINIEMLQRNPEIGHYRNDIPLGFLAWSFEQHIIIYETWENCIFVNRILHTKMNFIDQFQ